MIGTLTYTYLCDLFHTNTSHQGVGVFQFNRSNHWKAPKSMIGYSADLTNGERSENKEFKISDKLIELDEAMSNARDRFK
jgi:hypothetical protein